MHCCTHSHTCSCCLNRSSSSSPRCSACRLSASAACCAFSRSSRAPSSLCCFARSPCSSASKRRSCSSFSCCSFSQCATLKAAKRQRASVCSLNSNWGRELIYSKWNRERLTSTYWARMTLSLHFNYMSMCWGSKQRKVCFSSLYVISEVRYTVWDQQSVSRTPLLLSALYNTWYTVSSEWLTPLSAPCGAVSVRLYPTYPLHPWFWRAPGTVPSPSQRRSRSEMQTETVVNTSEIWQRVISDEHTATLEGFKGKR